MYQRRLALVALLLLASTGRTAAQNYAQESLDRYFRLEWQVTRDARGSRVTGFVYNLYHQPTDRVRLRVDALDAAGAVTARSGAWVAGGVPPDNRAWFEVRVPEAPAYRVQVESFDWVGRGGGS
jgi:hypothetical protein